MGKWLVAVLLGCGCATGFGAAKTSVADRFPTQEDLKSITAKPAAFDPAKYDAAVVERWQLLGPLPTVAAVTPVSAESISERAVLQAAPAWGHALTAELRCYAREYAHFDAARGKAPGVSLRDFMRRRCGVTARRVDVYELHGTVTPKTTTERLEQDWSVDLPKAIAGRPTPDAAGVSLQREGDRAVLVVASADFDSVMDGPVPLVGTNGALILRGRLARGGAERLSAMINHGTHGVETCKRIDAVEPPRFAFECPVDAKDHRTTAEVVAFDEGRLLGRQVAGFLLWPEGRPDDTWSRPAGSADVKDSEFNEKFTAAVNAVRAQGGLPAVTWVAEQSATAAELAPYFFEASFDEEEDGSRSDRIALGMMAGWNVKEELVSSDFGNEWVSGSRDMNVLMDFMLDSPFGRHAVVNPKATLLASGLVPDAGESFGVIFATYVPMPKFDRKAAEEAIIIRLNEMRLERKLPLAQWTWWPQDEGAVAQAKLASRDWSPDQAADYVLHKTAEVARGEVRGYLQLVDDLEHFEFPPEVLMRKNINVFLSVGVYRGPKWAHARYVVCFVLAKQGDIEVASN